LWYEQLKYLYPLRSINDYSIDHNTCMYFQTFLHVWRRILLSRESRVKTHASLICRRLIFYRHKSKRIRYNDSSGHDLFDRVRSQLEANVLFCPRTSDKTNANYRAHFQRAVVKALTSSTLTDIFVARQTVLSIKF